MKLRERVIRSDLLPSPSLPFMSSAPSYSVCFLLLFISHSQPLPFSPVALEQKALFVFLLTLTCILTFTATFFYTVLFRT